MNHIGDTKGFTSLKETATTHVGCLWSSSKTPSIFQNEVVSYAQYIIRGKDMPSPRLDSILEWWYRHSGKFPRLYKYARELLPIPAFSIDAAYYFGEYGILTHSLQETEVSKRNALLLASSELVEYQWVSLLWISFSDSLLSAPKEMSYASRYASSANEIHLVRKSRGTPRSTFGCTDLRNKSIRTCWTTVRDAFLWLVSDTSRSCRSLPKSEFSVSFWLFWIPTFRNTSTSVPSSVHPDYRERVLAARPPPQVPPQRTLKQEIEKLSTTMMPKKTASKTYVVVDQPKRAIASIQRGPTIRPTVPPQNHIVMPQATKRYYAVRAVQDGEVSGPSPKLIRRIV